MTHWKKIETTEESDDTFFTKTSRLSSGGKVVTYHIQKIWVRSQQPTTDAL